MFDNALPPASLALLQDINGELRQSGFYLAGGTGLALQLGHRVSEDLDFFTETGFDPAVVARHLEGKPGYLETMASTGTLHCGVAGVKLSFLHYRVPLKQPTVEYLSVRVADWRDILAEKFKTLSQRGCRRDFYDIYACFILKRLSIAEGVSLFKARFAGTGVNYQHVAKSLSWFGDADSDAEPHLLMPVEWPTVRRFFDSSAAEFARLLA